jgi:hypothetical protein
MKPMGNLPAFRHMLFNLETKPTIMGAVALVESPI